VRKLSALLLPLLFLPLRLRADREIRDIGVSGDASRGPHPRVPHFLHALVLRCLRAPRRLLTHSATAPEIHVIAGAAETDVIETAPPSKRAALRSVRPRVLLATPRVRPQTT
jgi:hypothetical protein